MDALARGDRLRIAYFVSSYGTGAQLLRLIRTIRRSEPDSPIVVHHDEHGSHPLDRTLLDGLDVTVLDAVEPIVWGDMSLETARWRAFRRIAAELDVDWVMLLSEQDYPIVPFTTFRERLAASHADVIMEAERIDEVLTLGDRGDARDRYYYAYRTLPDLRALDRLPGLAGRIAGGLRRLAYGALRHSFFFTVYRGSPENGMPDRIGVRARSRLFTPDFPGWVNNSWFALNARALRTVIDHVDTHPEFVGYYRRTVIPVESATATILCNAEHLRVDRTALHAIRWSDRGSGRPDLLTIDDLPFLDASGACFTRKVDPDDHGLLDALDARICAGQLA